MSNNQNAQECPPSYFGDSQPSSNLPSYTGAPSPNELLLSSSPISRSRVPSSYTYTSKRLTLYLGQREPNGTHAPAYGLGGVLEGWVEIRSNLRHVERVELTIEGIVTTTATERGFPTASVKMAVLSHVISFYNSATPSSPSQSPPPSTSPIASPTSPTSSLFSRLSLDSSSSSSIFSSQTGDRHDFSFPLPTYAQNTSDNTPLPPSFYVVYPGMEAGVRYTVRLDMYRTGFRRHERVETVFLYLPKSCPPSLRLPMYSSLSSGAAGPSTVDQGVLGLAASSGQGENSKSESMLEGEFVTDGGPQWKTVSLRSQSPNHPEGIVPNLDMKLSLLYPLSYPARSPIPFKLIIDSPTPILPELILANTTVSLVKVTVLTVFGDRFRKEALLAKTNMSEGKWNMQTNRRDQGHIFAERSISGGRERGEVAWAIPNAIEVKYVIRVLVKASKESASLEAVLPMFVHSEPIDLTTHSREEANAIEGVLEGPALGTIGIQRGAF